MTSPRQREKLWIAAGLLAIETVLLSLAVPPPVERERRSERFSGPEDLLKPGASLERLLGPGESHLYRIRLRAGQLFQAVAFQKGVDVDVTLIGPGDDPSNPLIFVDSPNGNQFSESLLAVTERSGVYRLLVRAAEGAENRGQYLLRVGELRAASGLDRLRAAAALAFAEAEELRRRRTAESWRAAIRKYERALRLWSQTGERDRQGTALYRIGWAHQALGEQEAAKSFYLRALELLRGRGEGLVVHNRLGAVYGSLGETGEALAAFRTVLRSGDRTAQAGALNNLAVLYRSQGKLMEAEEVLRRALALSRELGLRLDEARTLDGLTGLYLILGRLPRALDASEQALGLYRALGDRSGEASSLLQQGTVYGRAGLTATARHVLAGALSLARRVGEGRLEVSILNELSGLHVRSGDPGSALEVLRQAFAIAERIDDPRPRANTLANLGHVYDLLGLDSQALESFGRAEAIYRGLGELDAVASILYGRAQLWHGQGRLADARSSIEESLALIESLRAQTETRELRASFLESKRAYYGLHVDVLAQLARQEPGAGYEALAFEAGERMRARTLFEELAESRVHLRADLPREMLERRARLESELRRREDERQSLAGQPGPPAQARRAALEREIRDLLARIESLRTDLRRRSPRFAAFVDPRLLSLPETQQLLDEDTTLLAYTLGEERSFLWRVERGSVRLFELPGRAEIEAATRRAHLLLAQSRKTTKRVELERALTRLSRMLLGPLTEAPLRKRLLVLADGALQQVPFAALPNPRLLQERAEPLVARHVLASLPSASIAAMLLQEAERRPRPPGTVAVLANPVFRLDDPQSKRPGWLRLGTTVAAPSPRSLRGLGVEGLAPLPHSAREAEEILRLVPPETGLRAIGFDATRELAMSPELGRYRIVHFATHGLTDPRHPELSGIVLSLVDRRGRPRDGVLRSYQIYNLSLPVDLVVLSACRTAVDPKMRGEGLSALTRGFLYAGASRVLVSLWDVDDRATMELMALFYRGMLREGKSPAVALQAAQDAMRRSKTWQAHYFWAGFVLQGDWR